MGVGVSASPCCLGTPLARRPPQSTRFPSPCFDALPQFFRFPEAHLLPPIQSKLISPIAMAPDQTEKGKEPLSSAELRPAIEPAVGRSLVLNQEAMDKVRPMLASSFNEWGKTVVWPASRARVDRTATEVPFFIDALWAGLVPPFSAFFNAVLAHYQIHMLHLNPQSVTLLAVFAFVCEAIMGIAPSVPLLRQFFSLHLTDS